MERRYKPHTIRIPSKRKKFLDVLKVGKSISAACEVAKMGRRAAYDWREADPEFAKDWDEAIVIGNEFFENEARRRATEGIERPIYQRGTLVGTVTEYSDNLLMFMMKGRMPAKYKDNPGNTEVNNTVKVVNVPAPAEGNSTPTTSFRTREHLE